jgi:hypothetical protein
MGGKGGGVLFHENYCNWFKYSVRGYHQLKKDCPFVVAENFGAEI